MSGKTPRMDGNEQEFYGIELWTADDWSNSIQQILCVMKVTPQTYSGLKGSLPFGIAAWNEIALALPSLVERIAVRTLGGIVLNFLSC